MLVEKFGAEVRKLFDRIDETQGENIRAAGKLMAETMQKGQGIHIFDSGHIINSEMICRSGGLVAPRAYKFYLHTTDNVRVLPDVKNKPRPQLGLAELSLIASKVSDNGDLFIIGSVSGRAEQLVDLAISAKENHNCKIIALTSLEYSSQVESCHVSGKKLYEIADVVIDNCAPLGDSMVSDPSIPVPYAPASGLSATYIMWAVYGACIEEAQKLGFTPSIYKSANLPDGDEYNLKMDQRYEEFGY